MARSPAPSRTESDNDRGATRRRRSPNPGSGGRPRDGYRTGRGPTNPARRRRLDSLARDSMTNQRSRAIVVPLDGASPPQGGPPPPPPPIGPAADIAHLATAGLDVLHVAAPETKGTPESGTFGGL